MFWVHTLHIFVSVISLPFSLLIFEIMLYDEVPVLMEERQVKILENFVVQTSPLKK